MKLMIEISEHSFMRPKEEKKKRLMIELSKK